MLRKYLLSSILRCNNQLHHARTIKLSSSKAIEKLQSSSTDDGDDCYGKWQDKILYSSYIENSSLKMGYRKNKILESRLKKLEQINRRSTFRIQPFPVVLKQIQDEQFDELYGVKESQSFAEPEAASVSRMPYKELRLAVEKTGEDDDVEPNPKLTTGAWMSDYEYYDEDEQDKSTSFYGTPDASEPASQIPCGGCGALLHCIEPSIPGYLPSQLFKGKSREQLKTSICQRCHFLKNYNVAVNVTVSPNDYIEMLSSIKNKKALALLLVDVLDFPCSIWPGLSEILGPQRPVIVVGNKVDLLPQDCPGFLANIRQCLTKSIIDSGFARNNIKHVALISASSGYGVEELITKIHNVWGTRGDVYLVGCTNVGKSTLFNTLLRSDLCKVPAMDLVQRATASPWPGTTIRMLKFPILRPSDYRLFLRTKRLQQERFLRRRTTVSGTPAHPSLLGHIGCTFEPEKDESQDQFSVTQRTGANTPILTLNEKNERYINSKWCYDTPGVVQPDQILDLLTTEEIVLTAPKHTIRPRTYLLRTGMTIFLAGLGRLDYVDGPEFVRVILYASADLPTLICRSSEATTLYDALLGTKLLGVPFGNAERLSKFPVLESASDILIQGTEEKHLTVADVLLSSAGWFGVNLPKNTEATFRAWTPNGRGIHVRQPSLLPNGLALRGRRIRGSLAYRTGSTCHNQ